MVQWLRLHAPNGGSLGSIPDQRTRSHMPQLRPSAAKQINKNLFKNYIVGAGAGKKKLHSNKTRNLHEYWIYVKQETSTVAND